MQDKSLIQLLPSVVERRQDNTIRPREYKTKAISNFLLSNPPDLPPSRLILFKERAHLISQEWNYVCRMTAVSQVRLIIWVSQKSTVPSWAHSFLGFLVAFVCMFVGFVWLVGVLWKGVVCCVCGLSVLVGCFFLLPMRILLIFFQICLSKDNCSTYEDENEIFLTEDGALERQIPQKPFDAILLILPVQHNLCNLVHTSRLSHNIDWHVSGLPQ